VLSVVVSFVEDALISFLLLSEELQE